MSIVTKESNPELYNALFPEDEIKGILDEFINFDFENQGERIEINEYERNIIRDCITNLQEENQTLKNQLDFIEEQNHIIDKLEKENKKQEELISRLYNIISDDEENFKLLQENKELKVNCNLGNENLTFYRNGYKDYKQRNEKAIEYLANCDWNNKDFENLYDILGGDE